MQAVTVSEVDQLHMFVRSVIIRAKHHAEDLNEITMTLAGAILWKKDIGVELKVRKNVLWATFAGERYAFAYVPGNGGLIEVRVGSQQGPTIATFDNKSTAADVAAAFEAFKADPEWEMFINETEPE